MGRNLNCRTALLVTSAFAACLCSTSLGWAQSTGTISGTVTDKSGAVIARAKIKIQNADTGLTRELISDDGGRYLAPQLSLGNYSGEASQTGFQTEVRRGIGLNVGREAVVNLDLSVGSLSQQVEVSGEAPQVETTNASVAYLVDEKKVQDLPLNGRNYVQLAVLQPGVSGFNVERKDGVTGNGNDMSLSGTQVRQNLFLMDGQDLNDSSGGTPGSAAGTNLGIDAIREFTVITNHYNAEYGIVLGGIFNVVTRSGSNTLHGSTFEFLRNSALDAKNYFDLKTAPIPSFKRNQFGGSLGGPIKKDRTFFMGSYEALRMRVGLTLFNTVPNAAAHAGCLPYSVISPAPSPTPTTSAPQCANFPGLLGYVGVDPIIQARLNASPLPNSKDNGDGSGSLISGPVIPFREDYIVTRIDHQLSQNNSLFGRYIFDYSTGQGRQSVPIFGTLNESRYQYFTLNLTSLFRSNLVNQVRGSLSRTHPHAEGLNLTGIPDAQLSWLTGSTPSYWLNQAADWQIATPNMGFGDPGAGVGGSHNETPRNWTQTMYEFADNLSYTRGKHTLKAGALFQRYLYSVSMNNRPNPVFFTLQNFLQARVGYMFFNLDYSANTWQQYLFGWFVQDDIRVTRRLTLNIGLRHEFTNAPYEKYGKIASLRDIHDTAPTVGVPYTPTKDNFAPRLGLAWDVFGNGKTALRGGVGAFHEQDVVTTLRAGFSSPPPAYRSYFILFPASPIINTDNLPAASVSPSAWEPYPKLPTKYQWSLDVQQQIGGSTTVSAAYVGWRGTHFLTISEMNPRIPVICPNPACPTGPNALPSGTKFFPANAPRFNPIFGNIPTLMAWDGDAYYNALQMNLTRRFSRGLQFQGAYTWSKTIDISSSSWSGAIAQNVTFGPQDPTDLRGERGLSGNDIRHLVTGNVTYDLPFGSNLKGVSAQLVKGWQVNDLITFSTGIPFTIADGFAQSNNGSIGTSDRPNLVPGQSSNPTSGVSIGCAASGGPAAGTPLRTPTLWYDPCAFALQPAGTYGNLPRNTVIGPHQFDMDFSASKTFNFTERTRMQFRAEFFNIFNHPNFSSMNIKPFANALGARTGDAGQLTSTSTTSRQIQFGLKLSF